MTWTWLTLKVSQIVYGRAGGKSLCFALPAAIMGKLVLVVSPLIGDDLQDHADLAYKCIVPCIDVIRCGMSCCMEVFCSSSMPL